MLRSCVYFFALSNIDLELEGCSHHGLTGFPLPRSSLLLLLLLLLSISRIRKSNKPTGDHWRELRKTCVGELFTATKIASFVAVRKEEVERAMEAIRSLASNSAAASVDFRSVLMSLVSDVTCITAFGNCYAREGEQWARFHRLLEETQAMFSALFLEDYFPALRWVDKLRGMLHKVFLNLDACYQQLINEHLQPMRQRLEESEDTVDALLRVQKDVPKNLTDRNIKGVLMVIYKSL